MAADNQASLSLYQQLVKVTRVYLGPAAERFITRQIENHLDKPPQDITKEDLRSLISWLRGAIALLTEDEGIVEEYAYELEKLAGEAKGKGDV